MRTITRNIKLIMDNGRHQNNEREIEQAHRIPEARNSGDQSTDNDQGHAGHESLHRARADRDRQPVRFS